MIHRAKAVTTIGALLLSGLLGIEQLSAAIEVSVSTSQGTYTTNDLLTVDVTAYNPTDSAVTLNFPTATQSWYAMDGVYDNNGGAFQVLTSRTIPAYGSYTWSMDHDWSEYDLGAGTHSVVGYVGPMFTGSISSQPLTFEVVPPTLPTDDFLIDFTHAPSGSVIPPGTGADVYAGWGVHFGTQRDGGIYSIGIQDYQGNQFAKVNQTSYPPGFNILAEFDMPVYGISADVNTAVGYEVTMVAKDANGQVLDAVTSDTVSALYDFLGPLELQSSTPIASVEWWPSITNASVMIDDIFVSVTEPPLIGDLNGDGFIGITDLNIVLVNWNQPVTPGDLLAGDVTGEGIVGVDDLNLILVNWNSGTPPTAGGAIPEPTTAALLGVGILAITRRHQRR